MVSKSPERHTFQAKGYLKRCEEKGEEPNENYLELFKTFRQRDEENMVDPAWQKDNLEYDLRSTQWILDKARASNAYAQNIYAAMCNMRWQRIGTWPALADQYWSCSWRSSGGIVADMLQKGDYIDWYCSGIGGVNAEYDAKETQEEWSKRTGYVPEGVITDEIRRDFYILGWIPSPWPDDDK